MKIEQREMRLALAEKMAGHAFANRELLAEALTHRSYANESDEATHDYDRLEFLGDSVLDLIVAEAVMERFPELDSGDMTKLRASLVNEEVLAEIARSHGLGEALFLGVGEARTGGADKDSVLADVYEAVTAALYLDAGFSAARSMVLRDMNARIDAHVRHVNERDSKSLLQEICARRHLGLPLYRTVRRDGPDHDPRYTVECTVNSKTVGIGVGRNTKNAEQQAARAVLELLSNEETP